MNKQQPGIEWTHVWGPNTGYTWNVVQGCKHGCQWEMPGGQIAQCYAKSIAEKFQRPGFMENGFEEHYWNPNRLEEPLKLKTAAGIFLDSFSDLMGAWVPESHIRAVLDVCRRADWHVFMLLTKNAPRLLKFKGEIPHNVWIGASMPPTFMFGKRLSSEQQIKMFARTLDVFTELSWFNNILWLSLEPLSFDIAPLLRDQKRMQLDWLVIGAASNGARLYPPDLSHVQNVYDFADEHSVSLFLKGNMKCLAWAKEHWREEFPSEW
jgi:protein gp37